MEAAHLFVLSLYIVIPSAVARLISRGSWREIGQAYGIWVAMLFVLGWLSGGSHGEGFGWAIIMAMFTTVIAVPVIVGGLKLWTYYKTRAA